eukprot:1185372-Prorocentrum_minimum.AAC.4
MVVRFYSSLFFDHLRLAGVPDADVLRAAAAAAADVARAAHPRWHLRVAVRAPHSGRLPRPAPQPAAAQHRPARHPRRGLPQGILRHQGAKRQRYSRNV